MLLILIGKTCKFLFINKTFIKYKYNQLIYLEFKKKHIKNLK